MLTFTVSMLASIVHGSALQRLKRSAAIATKLAKPRAMHGATVRNVCSEAGKPQWVQGRGFVSGQYRIAKNVGLGMVMGVAGTIPYIVGYGVTDGYFRGDKTYHCKSALSHGVPSDEHEHDWRNDFIKLITGTMGAGMISGVGNACVAGPVGCGAFWGTIAAVGCAKAAKTRWEQHKTAQTKEVK